MDNQTLLESLGSLLYSIMWQQSCLVLFPWNKVLNHLRSWFNPDISYLTEFLFATVNRHAIYTRISSKQTDQYRNRRLGNSTLMCLCVRPSHVGYYVLYVVVFITKVSTRPKESKVTGLWIWATRLSQLQAAVGRWLGSSPFQVLFIRWRWCHHMYQFLLWYK